MKFKFLTQIFLSSLALSSIFALTNPVKAQQTVPAERLPEERYPEERVSPDRQNEYLSTTFECVTEGRSYATVARRGDRVTSPIILWRTYEFGSQYTPQNRCLMVSDRLTRAVNENGGRLTNLELTTGRVNGLPVICYTNGGQYGCNSRNLLLTLDSRNANNPNTALDNLLNFGVSGSGAPVVSFAPSSGINRRPSSTPKRISLERIVNEAFEDKYGDDETPVVRPQPSNSRQQPVNNGI
ncbi:COP23 domain-containing protein [Floridanema evergladense]|uniref:COP23 domain-containing protein n=1 Tax=Floridaenema evergladense BLCC-F167 TaxID=3153639 RepID=A0ABV4WEP9_9CYAN